MPLSYQWQRRLERLKSLAGFSSGGGNQPRPQICPACGSLVGISATKCHECGTNLHFSAAALGKKFAGIFGDNVAPVSTILLVANMLLFGVSWMALAAAGKGGGTAILWSVGGEGQYRLGMSIPMRYLLFNAEWWRVVTAMFLHGGLIHIGLNMMILMQFGPALEELYGSGRYLFLYTLAGAFGFVLSSFFNQFSLGASGALLGVLGATISVTGKRGGAFMRELRSRLVGSLILLFAMGFFPGLAMDNWAHAGGLVVGLGLGKLFVDRQPMNGSERRNSFLLGALAGVVIIASFLLMILHYRDPLPGQG